MVLTHMQPVTCGLTVYIHTVDILGVKNILGSTDVDGGNTHTHMKDCFHALVTVCVYRADRLR